MWFKIRVNLKALFLVCTLKAINVIICITGSIYLWIYHFDWLDDPVLFISASLGMVTNMQLSLVLLVTEIFQRNTLIEGTLLAILCIPSNLIAAGKMSQYNHSIMMLHVLAFVLGAADYILQVIEIILKWDLPVPLNVEFK